MKKVLFIIPTLEGGGAERVFIHILRHLDRTRFLPKLVLFEKKGKLLIDLPSDIEVIVLKDVHHEDKFTSIVFLKIIQKMMWVFRQQKPDIVLSFMWRANLVTLIGWMLSKVPCRVLVSERYSLSPSFEGSFVEFLRKMTIRFIYPKANAIIVNSNEMREQIQKLINVPDHRISVIYNPVDIKKTVQLSIEPIDHPWFKDNIPIIIGVGRMSRQKGFNYLIRAIHLLKCRSTRCRLLLLGTGAEEQTLKTLVTDLALTDNVQLLGFQQNPYQYISRSTIFVLSSLYEGFPNVLLEAMTIGIPSIATRCPTGPGELINDGVNGILSPVADEYALAAVIEKVLRNVTLRKRLSKSSKKRSLDFIVEKIVKQYEDTFEDICAGSAAN